MLEGLVLHRLAEVALHLTRRREDALNTGRRGRRAQELARHSRKRRPLGCLELPLRQQVEVHVVLWRLRYALCASAPSVPTMMMLE